MSNDYPNRNRRNKIIVGAVGLAAIGLGAATSWRRLRSTAPDAAVARFYAMSLPDAAGQPFAFSGLAGRPLVVNFWATWCPPCVEEMPELSALYYERSVVGLKMIGIGIDSPARIADFSARTPVSYPLVAAGMGGTELGREFGNAAGVLPYTVLIDAYGRIVFRIVGRLKLDTLRQQLTALG
jgi:thiol-disulfide isomerase/thioredoxin